MGREVEGVDCPLARRLAARVRLPGDRSGEDHGSGDDACQDGVPARAASTFHRNLDQAPECKRPPATERAMISAPHRAGRLRGVR